MVKNEKTGNSTGLVKGTETDSTRFKLLDDYFKHGGLTMPMQIIKYVLFDLHDQLNNLGKVDFDYNKLGNERSYYGIEHINHMLYSCAETIEFLAELHDDYAWYLEHRKHKH
jgi:hypothetical protein